MSEAAGAVAGGAGVGVGTAATLLRGHMGAKVTDEAKGRSPGLGLRTDDARSLALPAPPEDLLDEPTRALP